MSKGFTKEPDGSEPIELIERQISAERNLVTASGLKLINQQVEELQARLSQGGDELTKAQLARDLRYWQARQASAVLTVPAGNLEKVVFGHYVTLNQANTSRQLRIVGLDEADPKADTISYTSPLARELIGKEIGDEVKIAGKVWEITDISL